MQRRLDIEDAEGLAELAERAVLTVGTDPEAPGDRRRRRWTSPREIRSRPVTSAVSAVSAVEALRRRLVDQQRAIIASEPTGIVVEGRDIGTVVAPDAPLKVFLTASTAVRARRRSAEIGEAGDDAVAQTMAELGRRDALDSGRVASPLAQAPDAMVVDSSDLSVDSVVDLIVAELSERVGLADVRSAHVSREKKPIKAPEYSPRVLLNSRRDRASADQSRDHAGEGGRPGAGARRPAR